MLFSTKPCSPIESCSSKKCCFNRFVKIFPRSPFHQSIRKLWFFHSSPRNLRSTIYQRRDISHSFTSGIVIISSLPVGQTTRGWKRGPRERVWKGCVRENMYNESRTRRPALNFNITKSCNPTDEVAGALTLATQFIKITMKLLLREV